MKFVVRESGFGGIAPFELDADRFNEIKMAKATCVFGLDLEEKLALVLDNFYEFEVELLKLAEGTLIWPDRDLANSMRERLAIDRRLVNLLTACRLYLDQTDHGISGLFGNPSSELTAIKKFKNHLYDSHFGYRLMDALRNHVQHAGFAVHSIGYNFARSRASEEDQFGYSVIPKANVETLAENEEFNKAVLQELRSQGKSIDLPRPAREYVSCLIALHDEIRKTTDNLVNKRRKFYEEAAASYRQHKDGPLLFPNLTALHDDGAISEEIALAIDFLEYYDSLRKVRINQQIHLKFASNADEKT